MKLSWPQTHAVAALSFLVLYLALGLVPSEYMNAALVIFYLSFFSYIIATLVGATVAAVRKRWHEAYLHTCGAIAVLVLWWASMVLLTFVSFGLSR